jgi:PPK2 family polyphosphate:nucleotide phosphotransferase
MKNSQWMADPADLLAVRPGFTLADIDSSSTPGNVGAKKRAEAQFATASVQLNDLQERLWAESRFGGKRALLLVIQGMDTAGKGGIVEHVVGGISPEGVSAFGFKKPTAEELQHDFLWRVRKHVPEPGFIGVFDRSHYEDVLAPRVHHVVEPAVIEERYDLINAFEAELTAAGTAIVKVMLHISADEQKRRLTERLNRPDKLWKFNPADLDERALWPNYQAAYQTLFDRTSTPDAPWYVVPANHKWYARAAVQRLILDTLSRMGLPWPTVDFNVEAQKARLATS